MRYKLDTFLARDIRQARTTLGMSQAKLARVVGVKRAQIKRIEACEVSSVDQRVLQALGLTTKGREPLDARDLPMARASQGATLKSVERRKAKLRAMLGGEGLLTPTLDALLR